MSVQLIYSCNLCHEGGRSPLHGIYWMVMEDHDAHDRRRRDVATRREMNQSENHLCENCIRDIARIAGEIEP
jgi:hypothetical protein